MAHPRKFRFGIQLHTAPSAAAWTELARKAEDLGYSTLFMPDHFGDQLAPVPALTAAAAATTTLKVGALVFDNDYKHPVVMAKEIATLDLLSDGRVEFGLGAGWMNTDYEQSGIQHDRAGVRIDRMEEAISVFKGLFADGACSFSGDHYTITGLDSLPKPVQRPHPPFLIGGGGKRVLSIAAREADIVGINPAIRSGNVDAESAGDAVAERTDQKSRWIKDAAGDRYDDLEINALNFACIITDDKKGTNEMMAGIFGVTPEQVDEVPHVMIGSVDSICDDLRARRERWDMSYVVVQSDALDSAAPIVAALAGT
jgi:probable F420-dependent oxidoreductase